MALISPSRYRNVAQQLRKGKHVGDQILPLRYIICRVRT